MATSVSHFVKTVCLKDWWLTKAENNLGCNRVAVAGIESAGGQAARVFLSAPIVKRYDLLTLKTIDGIFVLLKGPINKRRTCENGFSKEVFKHFLIGFPSDWEKSAEKCFGQEISSEATSDADLNPELNAVVKMGNATFKLRQFLWKDSGSIERPENFGHAIEEADIELHDDQRFQSVEEPGFQDARSHAQGHNTYTHADVHNRDEDICTNIGLHDSNICFRGEVVRYYLRNRKVPHGVLEVCSGQRVKSIAGGRSLKKTMTVADTSISSVAVLKNSSTTGMLSLSDKSPKDKVGRYCSREMEQPNFAASEGVNDSNHANNIATGRTISVLGVAAAGTIGMQNNKDETENMQLRQDCIGSREPKAQRRHIHGDTIPVGANASCTAQGANKLETSTLRHSSGRKSHQPKKRKRSQRSTLTLVATNSKSYLSSSTGTFKTLKSTVKDANAANSTVTSRSLRKKTGASPDMSTFSQGVMMENSPKSGTAAAGGSSMQNGRNEDQNMLQTSGRRKLVRPNIQKKSSHANNIRLDANVDFTSRDADKLENSTTYHLSAGKFYESKKKRRHQRSILTRTTAYSKNRHASASSTSRTSNLDVKNNSKTAVSKRKRNVSQGSTPKVQTRRKLDFAEQTAFTPQGEKKGFTDFAQSSTLRTSRSGRLLLPTMEFWRNQLPIYDADHGISGIREGSTVLKFQRGNSDAEQNQS